MFNDMYEVNQVTSYSGERAVKALSATPSQSLQAHDNEVLERAAKIVESSANSDNNVYAPSCAEAIRALKGKV
jgi:hypothetical protein